DVLQTRGVDRPAAWAGADPRIPSRRMTGPGRLSAVDDRVTTTVALRFRDRSQGGLGARRGRDRGRSLVDRGSVQGQDHVPDLLTARHVREGVADLFEG